MQYTQLYSASGIVQSKSVRILMDPWLVDGEYYGSWATYPPYHFDPASCADIDFIYISHIHPDHFSAKTLAALRKDIPVYIHRFASPFLKRNIENLGFTRVVELEHNRRTHLKNGVHLNVLAADNCDPRVCGQFFGCGLMEKTYGSTQIDSLCVIDDGRHVLMNVNDCPFALAQSVLPGVLEQYGRIDLLLTGYAGAGPYPQCFTNLSDEEKSRKAAKKRSQFLEQGKNFVSAVRPRRYLPFAGTYTLAGRLSHLNDFRGVPETWEAAAWFKQQRDLEESECVLLPSDAAIDVATGESSAPYEPPSPEKKRDYIENVLVRRKFDFDDDEPVSMPDMETLIDQAYHRMEQKREQLGFATETVVYLPLGDAYVSIRFDGGGWRKVAELNNQHAYVVFGVDARLLARILRGPKYAHWDNASVGSHIQFTRVPDWYDRALYHVMCFFHA